MPRGPRFSVIIPTHERPALVQEAVSSVLAQTINDFEVIVVDDGSPGMPDLPSDRRVRLIAHEVNLGVSVARNTGIEAATGQYVCFLDDDDLYTPERLEIADEGLVRAPATACSKCFVNPHSPSTEWTASEDVRFFMASRWLHVGQLVIRREMAPRFDPRLKAAEDHDWAIQLALRVRPWPIDRLGYIVRSNTEPRPPERRDANLPFEAWSSMLSSRADFFDTRPDLLAWQWKRLGGKLMPSNRRLARRAFLNSMTARPSLRTGYHLVRTWV